MSYQLFNRKAGCFDVSYYVLLRFVQSFNLLHVLTSKKRGEKKRKGYYIVLKQQHQQQKQQQNKNNLFLSVYIHI